MSKSKRKEDEVSLSELVKAEQDLINLREMEKAEKGIVAEPVKFKDDPVMWLLSYRDRRAKVPINKKTYLKLCLLGVFGAHRFYAKQWITAVLYLLFFWTGYSIAMTIIDLVVVIPMQPDENGIIWI